MSPKSRADLEGVVQGVLSADAEQQGLARQRLQAHVQHFLTVSLPKLERAAPGRPTGR